MAVRQARSGSQYAGAVDFALTLRSENIPPEVLTAAKLVLLDTIGVGAAAVPMLEGQLARETATRLYNTNDPAYRARVLFDGRTASLAGSAFATATQIDNLDAHDGYNPTKGHIGVVAMPTLVVLAEHLPELTGPEALAALVVGYEVAGRAAMALHGTVSDYHTSGAWNALGVAAMGARLRGRSPEELRQALGIAEYHGPRSQMMREIANPTMLHDGSGQGALVGLSALMMAEMGFTGAPAITVEAPEVATYWADLGAFWQTEHQYIKPYPICRWAHAAIDAVRELALAHTFAPEDIERIVIRGFKNAVELYAGMPATTSQAQYSLPFSVGVMLVHGKVSVPHITGDGLSDPRVASMVERTEMIADGRHEARFPKARWSDVALHLSDGRVLHSGDVHARGGPERPFNEDDIVEKFMEFAAPVLGDRRARAISDAARNLNDPQCSFADLTRHLFEAP